MFDEDGYPQDLQNVLFQLFASFLLMSNSETLDDAKRLVKKVGHYILSVFILIFANNVCIQKRHIVHEPYYLCESMSMICVRVCL